jgi:NADH-quinone oxidoreductase subunit M
MIPVLFILIPLLGGAFSFFLGNGKMSRNSALISSLVVLGVSIAGLLTKDQSLLSHQSEWLPVFGSSFSVGLDGMGQLLCLLTAIAFPLIFLATRNAEYSNPNRFYGFMLLAQAGLLGVFTATDALLFYFFWELALIPAYFLCSIWGGEKRIAVTFKFFIYTFIGSLLMLVGLVYIYLQTPEKSFAMKAFYSVVLKNQDQTWLFWMLFAAFAIKMPLFPFHTWQPDTYEQSPTATTMVLSGLMVKMGVFAVIRWLAPVLPAGLWSWGDTASFISMFGIVYASLLAMKQDDLKRLVAYSSIAHIGLMNLAIFSTTDTGIQGVMIQMFNHGINIIGLWVVVFVIESKYNTRKISELGGLAQKAPILTILLMIVAFANIALPLTNGFIGEFLMFTGVFTSNISMFNYIYAGVAGLGIILGAVYTLNMIQKVFFGALSPATETATDVRWNEFLALGIVVVIIVYVGLHPQPLLDMTRETTNALLNKMITKHP